MEFISLIPIAESIEKYDMHITGVVHVGAHLLEEGPEYQAAGIEKVWWIEACPDLIPWIEDNLLPGHKCIHSLVTEEDRVFTPFNVTNFESMSSSVFLFGTHAETAPTTVFVKTIILESRTLDSLAQEYSFDGCNYMSLDLQGAELLALKGAANLLKQIDYIYVEVNNDNVYIGCPDVSELDEYLSDFERVETFWTIVNHNPDYPTGWGDALYIRKNMDA